MYDVVAYDLKTEGIVKIGEYFRVQEFKCYDGSRTVFVSPRLVKLLDRLRCGMRCAIYVNSGYRTPSHNKTVGGAANSMHMYGAAADIRPANGDLAKLHELAKEIMANTGGIGVYKTFIHVDVRDKKARWNG